jgi:hypothetical protein
MTARTTPVTPDPARPLRPYDAAIARAQAGLPPRWMVGEGETEFERVVREAGGEVDHPMVHLWVRKNYRRQFVPESVLAQVGIRPEEIA